MEQPNHKEKSLAWFKLADLIARGERAKALNVFRLLAHSLTDRAYALQLEGDILWYLNDQASLEKYKQAAFLYQKEKRWIDAISIYEHLLYQNPQSSEVLVVLTVFYAVLDWQEKFKERFGQLLKLHAERLADDAHIEKTFRELVDVINTAEQKQQKAWLFNDLIGIAGQLPPELAQRVRGLI